MNVTDDKEKNNAKDFPKVFYCRHMEVGLCGYENEKILIDADAMKAMMPSFAGKPVYVLHQTVDLPNLQETADGYVSDCFYNELDGWLWAKFIAVSDAANDALTMKGWSVSNAYIPVQWAAGGQHHNVDFNRKIVNAKFTHLAIVPDPRYEGAKVYTPEEYKAYCAAKRAQLEELHNSKGERKMFKIFRTKKEEVTNAADLTGDEVFELQNGKSVSLKDMISTVEKADADAAKAAAEKERKNAKGKKNSDDGAKEEKEGDEDGELKLNSDTEVEVGGKKMKLGELQNRYQNAMKKNSESEDDEETKKKKAEDEKKNAKGEDGMTDEERKQFNELKNARNSNATVAFIETSIDKVQRGRERY